MKSKGFTLIELLAIIVILAIIAVITIPQVSRTIEDSKKNATKDSAYGYKNAVHQFYLTNSSIDSEFDLNGEFDISNGVIESGNSSFSITTTGDVPKSGSVTIEDGEIVDGCINYGKYSVIIENGNVTDTVEGNCYNISYYTYDENADYEYNGYITSKLSEPNSSWKYFIKEYELPTYVYGVYDLEYEEFLDEFYDSLESCQNYIGTEIEQEYQDEFECRQRRNKKYEYCGVEGGNTFCLKTGESNYDYNKQVIDSIFDVCGYEDYEYICAGEDLFVKLGNYPRIYNSSYPYGNYFLGAISEVPEYYYGCGVEYDFEHKIHRSVCDKVFFDHK